MLPEALRPKGWERWAYQGMDVGHPLSVFNQSPESVPWNTPPKQQTLRLNLNDTPSRDGTLAIKKSTTTPFFHQKSRNTVFAWNLECHLNFFSGVSQAFCQNLPPPAAMATRKVRYKKLSVKTTLAVLREDQIDPSEYESLTNEAQIATGVEQAEENVSRTSPSSRHITCLRTCHLRDSPCAYQDP